MEARTASGSKGGAAAGARCPLCGGANDCARSARSAGPPAEAAPCWCVERRFPPSLLERARARDGGAACVCRACLEAAG
ncbi:MAG: cysteine-rich CWC family protein [Myxococcota bacterium]